MFRGVGRLGKKMRRTRVNFNSTMIQIRGSAFFYEMKMGSESGTDFVLLELLVVR